jgi:hypothetical protein
MLGLTENAGDYESWLNEVKDALASINMPFEGWQGIWAYDFRQEFDGGTKANEAALKANKFWWHEQNKAIGQDCQKTPNCWLPRDHRGECQRM